MFAFIIAANLCQLTGGMSLRGDTQQFQSIVPSHMSNALGVGQRSPYPTSILTISVVLAAFNEREYLAKTVESVQNMTPANILKEIIVVDDGSTPKLSDYLTKHPEVRVIRHDERQGLIRSKTDGGNAAVGDMVMFLDAHVKPDKDWYLPILKHVNTNYRRVVVPAITVLNGTTWTTEPNSAVGYKMMFDWGLNFDWLEDSNDLVPCMSGGLLGITRQWWHESGEYDYGMKMWGAENIEQSVRIWLCGGEIYVARDSKIGHVFRDKFPYAVNNTEIELNKVRTVEMWFDDYKQEYYNKDPFAKKLRASVGDMSDRLALKHKLQCKPFQTYVDMFQDVFRGKDML